MGFFEILLIGAGLAMDAFAVSLGAGTGVHGTGPRPAFRLSFHFGFFQFLMPVLGWSLGMGIIRWIAPIDHWVAFALLSLVGWRMIHSGLAGGDRDLQTDPTRGISLVILSLATSIDALAVGLTLALLDVGIWYPSATIGIVTMTLSLVGIRLGNRLSKRFGRRMEMIGGGILFFIGGRILVNHLFLLP